MGGRCGGEKSQDKDTGWGTGDMEVAPLPSPISTSTSWLHTSWKRLNTRQE